MANFGFATLEASKDRRMSMLDGPRVAPLAGPATHLVVLCHGYGSDGNDLIGLAPHWQKALSHAAFVSPNAPDRCDMAGAGHQMVSPSPPASPGNLPRGPRAAPQPPCLLRCEAFPPRPRRG